MGKRMVQKIRPWDPPSPRQGVAKAQLAASRVELRQVAVSRIPAEMTGKVWYCKNWLFQFSWSLGDLSYLAVLTSFS